MEKLDVVFDSLRCAAKLTVTFDFVLRNLKDGSSRYSYAQEKYTLLERTELVATTEDLTKITNLGSNTHVIESCTRERVNTKRKFYKLPNVAFFAAFFKELPMGCKDIVLPNPLLKLHSVNKLTFEENTRKPYNDILSLFRALTLHLCGTERLEEETFKIFNLSLKKSGGTDPVKIRGVCVEDNPAVEVIVQADLLFYEIDILVGSMIGELARRSFGKDSNT